MSDFEPKELTETIGEEPAEQEEAESAPAEPEQDGDSAGEDEEPR